MHFLHYFSYTNVLKISPKLRLDVLIKRKCVLAEIPTFLANWPISLQRHKKRKYISQFCIIRVKFVKVIPRASAVFLLQFVMSTKKLNSCGRENSLKQNCTGYTMENHQYIIISLSSTNI